MKTIRTHILCSCVCCLYFLKFIKSMAICMFHVPWIKLLAMAQGHASWIQATSVTDYSLFHTHLISHTCYQIIAELKIQMVNSWASLASGQAKCTIPLEAGTQICKAWLWVLTSKLDSGGWSQLLQDMVAQSWANTEVRMQWNTRTLFLVSYRCKTEAQKNQEIF